MKKDILKQYLPLNSIRKVEDIISWIICHPKEFDNSTDDLIYASISDSFLRIIYRRRLNDLKISKRKASIIGKEKQSHSKIGKTQANSLLYGRSSRAIHIVNGRAEIPANKHSISKRKTKSASSYSAARVKTRGTAKSTPKQTTHYHHTRHDYYGESDNIYHDYGLSDVG